MKLSTQIICFVILILVFTVGSITFLSYYQMRSIFDNQLENQLLDIAFYASEDYMVKEALVSEIYNVKMDYNINDHIEIIRIKTNVDFIVVFNMNGIRLTHPNVENIGKEFVGGDEKKVLTEGVSYASRAMGTLGMSIRVFVPIFQDGQQIGAVCVGSTLKEINQETYMKVKQFYPIILVGILLGLSCAVILTSNIKGDILGLEPKEIALMFKEKEAILDNVKEGIITLNEKDNIIQFNKEAERILKLTKEDLGKSAPKFIEENKVYESIKYSDDINEFEVKIKPGVSILCKINPIKNSRNQVIGQVINFRDLTEVKKMADELTGIKKMTWSLRAQNHEFMNKLHTISGLIELEEYDKALKYISKTVKSRDDITLIISNNIKNKSIAALILAKYYKAEELRINLEIDKESNLNRIPDLISEEELNSVIGNLLENSFDALNVDGTGKAYLKISENNDKLIIEVKDNGPGIPEEIIEKIYEPRVSTKSDQRGYGLYIVKKIIDESRGEILLTVDKGTSWYVEIPYRRDENI